MAKDIHVAKTVEIPEGVEVEVHGNKVIVRGPKGELEREFALPKGVMLRKEDNKVVVEAYFANARKRAMVGTVAAHIKNMIIGVTKGYRYKLKIIYSHFPINLKVEGDKLIINNFLGERAPRIAKILPGVKVTIDKKNNDIIIEGIDIEKVGQTAANIELATKVKDKDRRKFMDGIYIYVKGVAE
ncbi:MAG: 50S ribosomal protein L6 [Desulfurococcales archaeon]|nr:50S ribosomal protein L6 [Desulfurococcales archaeon]